MENHSIIFTLFCALGCFSFIYFTVEEFFKYETIRDQYYESEITIKPPLLDICTDLQGSIDENVLERYTRKNHNQKSLLRVFSLKDQTVFEHMTIGEILNHSESIATKSIKRDRSEQIIKRCKIRIRTREMLKDMKGRNVRSILKSGSTCHETGFVS